MIRGIIKAAAAIVVGNIKKVSMELLHITPNEAELKLGSDSAVVILDVREKDEISRVRMKDDRTVFAPLSDLARDGIEALPEEVKHKDREIIVLCHHGIRSLQVANWLLHHGWKKVFNLVGGIDAYAQTISPEIGRY